MAREIEVDSYIAKDNIVTRSGRVTKRPVKLDL